MTCLSGKKMQGGLSSLVVAATAALSLGVGCIDREAGPAAARDDRDAAVVTRAALTSSEATWTNLWGSWPQTRYSHAMAYDSDRKVMVMYGGQAAVAGPFYNDTWEWDPARASWTQRVNTGTDAGTRSGHALAYDPGTKRVLMFSGWQPSASFYIPGQVEWDPVGSAWVTRPNVSPQPTPRHDHAMVYNPDRQRIVMYGGFDETTGRRQDIWEWNGANGTWENCTPAVAATMMPAPRFGHTLAYDTVRKKVIMRGGNTGAGNTLPGSWVNETWEWTAGTGATCNTGSWAVDTTTGTAPSNYSNAGFDHIIYDTARMKTVLYEYGYANVTWELDPMTPTWTSVPFTKSDTAIPTYGFNTFVYDPVNANSIAFGGQGGGRALWTYDGAQALFNDLTTPLAGPIQRQGPALAFDSKRGHLILFSGYRAGDANPYKQDIYQWSGTDQNWINETTAAAKPDPRYLSAMAYDSKRDLVYMFGGSGSTTFSDFWAWAPATTTWSTVTVTSGSALPTARNSHSLFYDSKRDRLVMYGGSSTEIWEFDPTAAVWTKRSPLPAPAQTVPLDVSNRSYTDVTYDQDRGKIVMIGGYSYNTATAMYQYDTAIWEWDVTAATWGQLIPAASSAIPAARTNHTIVYDGGRRVVVMFGGRGNPTTNNVQLNDSWEWDAASLGWTQTTPTVGIAPLPRESTTLIYDSTHGSTFLFGGTVNADTTYGPQEIWTYSPNNAPRPNGSPCSTATATSCSSGFCVDGVCCAASSCSTKCQACNVPGATTLGVCSYVAAGTADDSCSSGQACDVNHVCKPSLGQSCGTFTDCATGHCADGACCDTDCTDSCKACNLTGKIGTCSNLPSGREDPVAAPACVSDSTQPRYCDGNGVCTNAPKPIGSACTASGQCVSPSFCIDGVCCNQACNFTCYTCNNGTNPGSCLPLAAGLQDHSATATCDASNQYCVSGSCQSNKKPNGQTCQTGTDCGSGYCVDSTCCNSACTGTCQACNVPAKLGSCVNVPAGSADNSAATACALPQYCDAAGTCQTGLKGNGISCTAGNQCGSGNCVDGLCCDSACGSTCYACNNPGSEGTCGPIAPGGTDPTAATPCTSPNYCTNGACSMGKKPNGASCGLGNECGSNYCIDGTCCENACIGTCLSCKNATGSCTFAAKGTDARKNCGAGDCGGTCDGAGSCAFPPQGKVCGTTGCASDGVIHQPGTCDGAGNCAGDVYNSCNGFRCFHDMTDNTDKCATSCLTDPNCQIAFYCDNTQKCPPSLGNGQVCSRDAQCVSNHCAIAPGSTTGLCCDRDCHACGSCNLPGKEGTCVPALAGTDPNHDCIDSASDPSGVCGGKCNGQWACQFPAAGTTCGLCKVCDGASKCNVMPEDDTTCGVIDCDGLDTTCSDYNDLKSKRCATVGTCKAPNTATACTDVTSLCPDAGTGAGGSGGPTDAGSSDAGAPPKSGGGGCGCDVGAGSSGSFGSLGLTLLAALVLARRRGRRR